MAAGRIDDVDTLSDDELEARIAGLERDRPTEHQLAGGAPRSYAWLVTVLAAIGVFASVELIAAELQLLRDPQAQLLCDVNPLIGCGTFLQTPQGHVLFGLPNAVPGAVAFGGLLAVGVTMLAGARYARWFWLLLVAGTWVAALSVVWFMGVSFFVVHALCPFCLVVWLVTIPLVVHTTARAIQGGHLRVGEKLGRFLVAERGVLTVVAYVALALALALAYRDAWLLLLSGAF